MKNKNLWLTLCSFAGLIIGYLILHSDLQPGTTGEALVRLGKGLFYGMGALTLVFIILLFIPRAFQAWKKFAIWFVPLAALLFVIYPEPSSGDFFSPYPEQVFQWVSALYILISVVIIAIASRKRAP